MSMKSQIIAAACACSTLVSPALAQSFSAVSGNVQAQSSPGTAFFVLTPAARKISFSFIPPARKMFADLQGNTSLFPALFPNKVFFERVRTAPSFFSDRFSGAFSVYRVGDYYLGLDENYTLFSATIRNGSLFVLAKDRDGDFVALDASHIAVYRSDGTPEQAREVTGQAGNISVLVDRSASIAGFDADIGEALTSLSSTLVGADHCALYEFGQRVHTVQVPNQVSCKDLFAHYQLSNPGGGTPLFEAMHDAYTDLRNLDTLSAAIIISDGEPSDRPSPRLRELAETVPTFVLWVGNHRTDYLAEYSTAHAISQSGGNTEIADFLRAISFSVSGHQRFNLSQP